MTRYIFIAALFLLSAFAFAQEEASTPVIETDYSSSLTIQSGDSDHAFAVEIADTREKVRQGMMHRPEMAADVGMLFIREQKSPDGFWMRNTLVSLDIIFIGNDGEIVSIAHNAVPLSERNISPGVPVRYILEIKGGQAGILGIRPGDIVRHERLGNES